MLIIERMHMAASLLAQSLCLAMLPSLLWAVCACGWYGVGVAEDIDSPAVGASTPCSNPLLTGMFFFQCYTAREMALHVITCKLKSRDGIWCLFADSPAAMQLNQQLLMAAHPDSRVVFVRLGSL